MFKAARNAVKQPRGC